MANNDELDSLPGTAADRAGRDSKPAASKVDYKAMLDKAADASRDKANKEEPGAGQPDGLVSKVVDKVSHVLPASGKQLLGVGSSSESSESAPSGTTETRSRDSKDIPNALVQEFIRDAHRSRRVSPKAEGI